MFGKYIPGDRVEFKMEHRPDIEEDLIIDGPYFDGIWRAYTTKNGNVVREYEISEVSTLNPWSRVGRYGLDTLPAWH